MAAVGPVAVPVTAVPIASGAGAAVAAETAAVTTGIEKNTAALQTQGAAALQDAAALKTLAAAASFAGKAEAEFAAGQEAALLSTTAVAASRKVLTGATEGVRVAEKGMTAALATGNVALIDAAAATLADARAKAVNARASVRDAIAQHEDAAAARESAAAHSQAARGALAQAATLTGLRGATLAASAPFLLGTVAIVGFTKSIQAASDETEQFNKVAVVFGSSAQEIEDFAKSAAQSFGISSTAALTATGIFGNLFRTIHIATPVAADMSIELVKLASDLASFNNASPERTLEALRAGLVGQARPLRQFGIFLSAARVQQEALIETGKKNVKQITDADKVQARFNLILRDSSLAQGDFARTSDRTANQSRILAANVSNLEVKIGDLLLPTVERAVHDLNAFFFAAGKAGGALKSFGRQFETPSKRVNDFALSVGKLTARVVLLSGFEIAGRFVDHFSHAADTASVSLGHVGGAVDRLDARLNSLAGQALPIATAQFTSFTKAAQEASDALLKLQSQGAPPQRQLPAAQAALAADQGRLNQLLGEPSGTKGRATAIRKIRQQIISDRAEIKTLTGDIADVQKKAAQDAKDAAAKAKDARDKQDQALLDLFQGQQTRITDALISAGPRRELALTIKLRNLFRQQREETRKRIQDLQTRKATLTDETTQIKELNKQIKELRKQQADALAEQVAARRDAQQAHLEALLSIAETTKSTSDDKKREKALIAFDQAQIRRILAIKRRRRLTIDEAAQLDALRVDVAQRKKAIDDLNKQTKDTQKSQESLFFTFLQTQQGFAANLLGNLIPGFATAGLVGGSQAAAAGPSGVAGFPGGPRTPEEHGRGIGATTALAASRDRGVRPVQVDTTNHLLRQILRSLQNLNGRASHPEARHQKSVAIAGMDTFAN